MSNYVVNVFGGREGCLGNWYALTIDEETDERIKSLRGSSRRIEYEQERKAKEMEKMKKDIVKLWNSNRNMEARQKARDLRSSRTEYTRLGVRKTNEQAMVSQLSTLRSSTSVTDNFEFFVRAMSSKMSTTNPERFQRVLAHCDKLQDMKEMSMEMLDGFFAEEETREKERAENESMSEDQLTDGVLRELGIPIDAADAPDVPLTEPGGNKGGEGGNSGGGGSNNKKKDTNTPFSKGIAATSDGRIIEANGKKKGMK